jgi:O-antigen ligase
VGPVELSEPVLLAAAAALLLRERPWPRPPGDRRWPGRGLILGLVVIAVGGLVGGLFRPDGPVYSVALSYQGAPLGPVPAFVADVLRFVTGTVLVVLVVRAWRPRRAEVELAALAYAVGAAVSALDGALGPSTYGRTDGLNTHPVPFGLACALGVVISVGLVLGCPGWMRSLAIATGLAGAAGVLASGTRGALLVVVLGIVLVLAGARTARTLAVPAAMFVLVTALGLVAPSLVGESNTVARLDGGASAETSDVARATVREETIALVRIRGITGAGFEFLAGPHNLVLGVVASAGVLGLAGLVVVIVTLVRVLSRSRGDPVAAALSAAVLAMYLPFWIVNPGWERWLWVPVALMFASSKAATDPRPLGGAVAVPAATDRSIG